MRTKLMQFNLGNGQLSIINLFLSFLFAKAGFATTYFFLRNGYGLSEDAIIFIGRSLELVIFLALTAASFSPNRFPLLNILRVGSTKRKTQILLQAIALTIGVVISRYIIELIVVILGILFDPRIILDAPPPLSHMHFSISSIAAIFSDKRNLPAITITPVVEEIIYRGVLLNFLLIRLKVAPALIVSSVAFAALHGNPVTAFLCGLIFGHIYILTKNIWLCVLAHSITNATVILLKNFGQYIYPSFRYDANLDVDNLWLYLTVIFAWTSLLTFFTFQYRLVTVKSPFFRD